MPTRDREIIQRHVKAVIDDLTSYLVAVHHYAHNRGEEWGYQSEDEVIKKEKILADSLMTLFFPDEK